MEEKEIRFSVQMTPKELFRFTFYHNYHRLSGIIGIVLSITALAMLVLNFNELGDQNKAVLGIVALWFLVFEPFSLRQRAKTQVKRTPSYQKPLQYLINADGITISQGEECQNVGWDKLVRIVETQTQFYAYSSKIHAFVFPKTDVGDQCDPLREKLIEYAKNYHIKLSGRIRKQG